MDPGLPERIRQMQSDGLNAAHEGDSAVFCRVMMLIHGIRDTMDDDLYPARQKAMQDKIDSAYIAYAITAKQWGMCYDVLSAPPEATPDNGLGVYLTEQSKLQPVRTPPER